MFNVRLNYISLQIINATFFLLSYLFVEERLDTGRDASIGEFVVLLAVVVGGAWAFYTNRLFYIVAKHSGVDVGGLKRD